MSPAIIAPLLALVVLAAHVVRSARRRRRAAVLLADLAAEHEGRPVFPVAALHLDPSGAALVACDARASLLHLASHRGARVESARLPAAHLEGVAVLEDGESAGDASRSRTVGRVTLRVAIADERRSFHDIGFLDARVVRGSARHRRALDACHGWASALSGETRDAGVELPGAVLGASEPTDRGEAGRNPAASGAGDRGRALTGVWPLGVRVVQGGLAVALTLAAIGPLVLSSGAGPPAEPSVAATPRVGAAMAAGTASGGSPLAEVRPGGAPRDAPPGARTPRVEASATGGSYVAPAPSAQPPGSPEERARAFAAELAALDARLTALADTAHLDESGARPDDIVARVGTFDAIARRVDAGRALPLGTDAAAALEALAARLHSTREDQLPRYRALFARATRRGSSPVGAWASGEGNRVLELTRLDLDDAGTRERVWETLAGQIAALRFSRVDFRAYRGAALLESRTPDTPADGTTSVAEAP